VKWLKVIHGYAWDMGIPGMFDAQVYQAMFKDFAPILTQIDRTTSDLFLPALADGQAGLVIDAKLTGTQWSPLLPPSTRPCPCRKLALVLASSDAGKLKKAGAEYRASANQLMVVIGKIAKQELPTLPPPQSASINGGEMFFYPLPPGTSTSASCPISPCRATWRR